jgi:hypothetical protein
MPVREDPAMSNRRERCARLARYKRESGGALITYLVDVDLEPLPQLLACARGWWLDALPGMAPPRHCFACRTCLWDRKDVGALPFSTPSLRASAASINAICNRCWTDRPLEEVERAAAKLLRAVMPGGHFETLPC